MQSVPKTGAIGTVAVVKAHPQPLIAPRQQRWASQNVPFPNTVGFGRPVIASNRFTVSRSQQRRQPALRVVVPACGRIATADGRCAGGDPPGRLLVAICAQRRVQVCRCKGEASMSIFDIAGELSAALTTGAADQRRWSQSSAGKFSHGGGNRREQAYAGL